MLDLVIDRADPRVFCELYLQVKRPADPGGGGAGDAIESGTRAAGALTCWLYLSTPQTFSQLYNADALARDRVVSLV